MDKFWFIGDAWALLIALRVCLNDTSFVVLRRLLTSLFCGRYVLLSSFPFVQSTVGFLGIFVEGNLGIGFGETLGWITKCGVVPY